VRIPPGADNGSRLRVAGKGAPGLAGGGPGDLVIETVVRPHPFFKRDGLDLVLKLPVTLAEALGGASVEVPTPQGTVKLTIPPGSQPGTRLRLRGRGVKRGDKQGDLYAEVDLRLPDGENPALVEAGARRGEGPRQAGARGVAPMTEVTMHALLEMLEGDREIVEVLRELEVVAVDCESFGADQVECALVARTLMRELDVNPPGIDIILRMRSQMLAMQRQMGELFAALRRAQGKSLPRVGEPRDDAIGPGRRQRQPYRVRRLRGAAHRAAELDGVIFGVDGHLEVAGALVGGELGLHLRRQRVVAELGERVSRDRLHPPPDGDVASLAALERVVAVSRLFSFDWLKATN
jgi:hypothetical protein